VAAGFHAFNQRRVEEQISDARIQATRLAAALAVALSLAEQICDTTWLK
jgi:hypothetical protein